VAEPTTETTTERRFYTVIQAGHERRVMSEEEFRAFLDAWFADDNYSPAFVARRMR
jgi:hypothetical protein